MADYLRLRQVCVVAPELDPAVDTIRDLFGLEVCFRDVNVAKYGLVNALFVFGHAFLEIVAPTRPGTAAQRFIERSGGRGGYMAIFDCSDPVARRERALAQGVRVAHELDYPEFFGSQLHPRDCRATMLEFDQTVGGDPLDGAHHPAGHRWHDFQRLDRVAAMPLIEISSPQPADLAAHWSRLIDRPVGPATACGGLPADAGALQMAFDLGAARFVGGAPGSAECLSAVHVAVADPAAVMARARARGLPMSDNGIDWCGVRLVPCQA